MKKKNTKHSIVKEKSSKLEKQIYDWEDYQCLKTFKMQPKNQESLIELAKDLYTFAALPTSLCLEDFWLERGIPTASYYRYKARCKELQEAHDHALLRIGNRRERGAVTREFDSSTQRYTAHNFGEKWIAQDRYHVDLKKELALVTKQLEDLKRDIKVEIVAFSSDK